MQLPSSLRTGSFWPDFPNQGQRFDALNEHWLLGGEYLWRVTGRFLRPIIAVEGIVLMLGRQGMGPSARLGPLMGMTSLAVRLRLGYFPVKK